MHVVKVQVGASEFILVMPLEGRTTRTDQPLSFVLLQLQLQWQDWTTRGDCQNKKQVCLS